MAQSVRRPPSLGVKNHEPKRDKSRISYFGNVKSRSGSQMCRLPKGEKAADRFFLFYSQVLGLNVCRAAR